jgi:hypothetical protein
MRARAQKTAEDGGMHMRIAAVLFVAFFDCYNSLSKLLYARNLTPSDEGLGILIFC